LNKLYCEVLEFNDKVITFHKKHGFSVEGIFKNQHFSKGRLWDIYRLAIFKKDWNRLSIELPLMRDNKFGPGKTFTHQFSISKEQVLMFSEASSDTNKLHIDDAYSREYGFDKSLVHGFLSGSVFSKIFGTLFPGEGTIYKSQSLEFKSPIYPNTELNAKIHIETKIGNRLKVRTLVLDKDDNPAITGYAEIILPLETA
ncbi:MaoC/PaaZ C-terminal domain-containing protein, partial [Oleiphilus sp. HI0125]